MKKEVYPKRPFLDSWDVEFGDNPGDDLVKFSMICTGRFQIPYKANFSCGISTLNSRILLALYTNNILTMTELATLIYTSRTQASKSVDELVEMSFVERVLDKNDRRVVKVKLTNIAMDYFIEAVKRYLGYLKESEEALSNEERDALYKNISDLLPLLYKMPKNLQLLYENGVANQSGFKNKSYDIKNPYHERMGKPIGTKRQTDILDFTLITSGCFAIPFKNCFCFHGDINVLSWRVFLSLKLNSALTMSKLAESISTSPSQASKTANDLFELGFVERILDKNDRRIVKIALTGEGNKFLEESIKRFFWYMRTVMTEFSKEEYDTFLRLIRETTSILVKMCAMKSEYSLY